MFRVEGLWGFKVGGLEVRLGYCSFTPSKADVEPRCDKSAMLESVGVQLQVSYNCPEPPSRACCLSLLLASLGLRVQSFALTRSLPPCGKGALRKKENL